MPYFTLPIEQDRGALLNMQLSISGPRIEALQANDAPVPDMMTVKGLVDTGASCTCIDPSVVESLDLSRIGTTNAVTPSTGSKPQSVNQYEIGVLIYSSSQEQPMVVPIIGVIEMPLINQGFHAIIGRDILSQCLLVYDGRNQTYSFCY